MGCDLRARVPRDPDVAGGDMTKYLISFPSEAMVVADEELPEVSVDAHAVIEEAKAAGVYVFGGGIDEQVEPVLVSGDGSVSERTYPGSRIKGGFTVLRSEEHKSELQSLMRNS